MYSISTDISFSSNPFLSDRIIIWSFISSRCLHSDIQSCHIQTIFNRRECKSASLHSSTLRHPERRNSKNSETIIAALNFSCRLCALFFTTYEHTTYAPHSDPKWIQIGRVLVATPMAGKLYSACISNLLQNRHYHRLTQSRHVHVDLSHPQFLWDKTKCAGNELVRMLFDIRHQQHLWQKHPDVIKFRTDIISIKITKQIYPKSLPLGTPFDCQKM